MSDKIDLLLELQKDTRSDVKEIMASVADISARTRVLEKSHASLNRRMEELEGPTNFLRTLRKAAAWVGSIVLAITGIASLIEKFKG